MLITCDIIFNTTQEILLAGKKTIWGIQRYCFLCNDYITKENWDVFSEEIGQRAL
jgi:hypothetical protein